MNNQDTSALEERYRLIKMKEQLIREGKSNVEIEELLLEAGFNFSSIKKGFSNLAGNAFEAGKKALGKVGQNLQNAWNNPPEQSAEPKQAVQQKKIIKPAKPGDIKPNENLKFDTCE